MGGFGSDFFRGIFAKDFGASGWVEQRNYQLNFSLSTLAPAGGFGSENVGGIFAEYFQASGCAWQRFFR